MSRRRARRDPLRSRYLVPVVSGSAALRNDDTLCAISLPSIGRAVVVRSSWQTTGDERVGFTPKVLVFRRYQPSSPIGELYRASI
jgi:hypothetical protein